VPVSSGDNIEIALRGRRMSDVVVRQATVEDAEVIARHRALMFAEMHLLAPGVD
jgi:hypothetical protein